MSTRLLLPLTTLLCLVIITLERTTLLPPLTPVAGVLAGVLYRWALLLAAAGLLAGVLNAAWVHGRRVQRGAREWALSLALLATLLAVLLGGTISGPLARALADSSAGVNVTGATTGATTGTTTGVTAAGLASASVLMEWIFDSILAPGQRALFALLAFFVAAAAYDLLRVQRPSGRWMLLGTLAVLLVQMPAAADIARAPLTVASAADTNAASAAGGAITVADAAFWLLGEPVTATVRGVLLGSGLALLTAAVRALRPSTSSTQ